MLVIRQMVKTFIYFTGVNCPQLMISNQRITNAQVISSSAALLSSRLSIPVAHFMIVSKDSPSFKNVFKISFKLIWKVTINICHAFRLSIILTFYSFVIIDCVILFINFFSLAIFS